MSKLSAAELVTRFYLSPESQSEHSEQAKRNLIKIEIGHKIGKFLTIIYRPTLFQCKPVDQDAVDQSIAACRAKAGISVVASRCHCKVLLLQAANFNGKSLIRRLNRTTNAITMKLSLFSFGTNSNIVTKFQTDRFGTFDKNRAEKNKEITLSKPYQLAAATPRSAVAGGVKNYRH